MWVVILQHCCPLYCMFFVFLFVLPLSCSVNQLECGILFVFNEHTFVSKYLSQNHDYIKTFRFCTLTNQINHVFAHLNRTETVGISFHFFISSLPNTSHTIILSMCFVITIVSSLSFWDWIWLLCPLIKLNRFRLRMSFQFYWFSATTKQRGI